MLTNNLYCISYSFYGDGGYFTDGPEDPRVYGDQKILGIYIDKNLAEEVFKAFISQFSSRQGCQCYKRSYNENKDIIVVYHVYEGIPGFQLVISLDTITGYTVTKDTAIVFSPSELFLDQDPFQLTLEFPQLIEDTQDLIGDNVEEWTKTTNEVVDLCEIDNRVCARHIDLMKRHYSSFAGLAKLAYVDGLSENCDIEQYCDRHVPASGPAETLGGEILRCMAQIDRRWYDGHKDRFYCYVPGYYGSETVTASYIFLKEHIGEGFPSDVRYMISDNQYECFIQAAWSAVCYYLGHNGAELYERPRYTRDNVIPAEGNNDERESAVRTKFVELGVMEQFSENEFDVTGMLGPVEYVNLGKVNNRYGKNDDLLCMTHRPMFELLDEKYIDPNNFDYAEVGENLNYFWSNEYCFLDDLLADEDYKCQFGYLDEYTGFRLTGANGNTIFISDRENTDIGCIRPYLSYSFEDTSTFYENMEAALNPNATRDVVFRYLVDDWKSLDSISEKKAMSIIEARADYEEIKSLAAAIENASHITGCEQLFLVKCFHILGFITPEEIRSYVISTDACEISDSIGAVFFKRKRSVKFLTECLTSGVTSRIEYATEIIEGMKPTSNRAELAAVYEKVSGKTIKFKYEAAVALKEQAEKLIIELVSRNEGASRSDIERELNAIEYTSSGNALQRLKTQGLIILGNDRKWYAKNK